MTDDRFNLAAGAAHVKQRLQEAGLAVTVDPRQVEVPGCFVAIDRLRWRTLGGTTELDITVWLIAPDNGDHLVLLSGLLELAGPALDWTSDQDMPVVTLELSDRSLPALQLTTKLDLTKD